jgi:hypothetical protein
MSLLTRRIWSFLKPDGYVTKQDRMQLAVGYSRSPTTTVTTLWDTLVKVVLGAIGGLTSGGGYGIPNVVTAPYDEFKRDYIFLSNIHIKEKTSIPHIEVENMNEIEISVKLL